MELKVWVEGIQRIVCGVTEVTTCQDVVYALAHATGKTGRFTLMERWRNSERLLAPHEHPLKILLKWGEYASDVQFILQRTALEPKSEYRQESKLAQSFPPNQRPSQPIPGGPQRITNKAAVPVESSKLTPQSPLQNRDIKKSLTFSGGHSSHLPISTEGISPVHGPEVKKDELSKLKDKEDSLPEENSKIKGDKSNSPSKAIPKEKSNDFGEYNENFVVANNLTKGLHTEGDKNVVQSIIKQLVKTSTKEINSIGGNNNNNNNHSTEEVIVDGYYRELVKLVNQQREKISSQQVDLTKYEAEIAFAEGRRNEEESRLVYLQEEIQKLEKTPEKPLDLKLLSQLEEQLKTAKKAESSAKEDIASLQKKIVACDQKLAQMIARVRSIEEALRKEELAQQQKAQEAFQEEEQDAMRREIEKLQMAVEQAMQQADHTQGLSQQLSQEMHEAELRLEERRKEIEALKQAMRDANLEALSMTPPDEAKALSDRNSGSTKSGTIRRMVGSPRQLETAVPTSKNPHGVWV